MDPGFARWWQGRSALFWLILLSPLLVMGACGLFSLRVRKDAAAAERAAAVFHRRLAAEQYDAVYQDGSPDFRLALTRADSAKYFRAIRDKVGLCEAPAAAAAHLTKSNGSGNFVQLRFRLQCTHGALQETILFVMSAGGPHLAGYDATSPSVDLR